MFQPLVVKRAGSTLLAATIPRPSSRDGNPDKTIRQVTISVQVKTGIRSSVTCGARIRRAVHSMVALIKSMPTAARNVPAVHNDIPSPGAEAPLDSGVYPHQPSCAPPVGVTNPQISASEPKT